MIECNIHGLIGRKRKKHALLSGEIESPTGPSAPGPYILVIPKILKFPTPNLLSI